MSSRNFAIEIEASCPLCRQAQGKRGCDTARQAYGGYVAGEDSTSGKDMSAATGKWSSSHLSSKARCCSANSSAKFASKGRALDWPRREQRCIPAAAGSAPPCCVQLIGAPPAPDPSCPHASASDPPSTQKTHATPPCHFRSRRVM